MSRLGAIVTLTATFAAFLAWPSSTLELKHPWVSSSSFWETLFSLWSAIHVSCMAGSLAHEECYLACRIKNIFPPCLISYWHWHTKLQCSNPKSKHAIRSNEELRRLSLFQRNPTSSPWYAAQLTYAINNRHNQWQNPFFLVPVGQIISSQGYASFDAFCAWYRFNHGMD